MKLLIAGSRSIGEFDLEKHIPQGVAVILTGGAEGIGLLEGNQAYLSLRRKNEKRVILVTVCGEKF